LSQFWHRFEVVDPPRLRPFQQFDNGISNKGAFFSQEYFLWQKSRHRLAEDLLANTPRQSRQVQEKLHEANIEKWVPSLDRLRMGRRIAKL